MISIQSAMLVALGFLGASLLGLLVASAFWSRAVRLTTARIKQSMPVSEPEIKADRDKLRAEYAIKVHKLEMLLEQARLARARQSAMDGLKKELGGLRTGRASVNLLDPVMVEAYGQRMPLNQVGTVSAPEPRLLTVNVWDKGLVVSTAKAIRESL